MATSRKRQSWRSESRSAPGVPSTLKRLGKRMRALRTDLQITQAKAAERARIDEKHWQQIETAKINTTVATLLAISKALKVSLSELFEDV